MPPKVFVSHASEDKERFVVPFAISLRENGVDAWLDKWEMTPGDSLVDKLFEEGLKEAAAVIVVLSKFSVNKPWVREELNAAFVKRINCGSKLIPVVIDDCEIPEALKSTLWERVVDLNAYQPSLDRVLASIFGSTDKPPLGSPPAYMQSFVASIGGLNNVDSLVLKLACDHAVSTGNDFLDPEKLFLGSAPPLVPETELLDALEILDRNGHVRISRVLSGGLSHFRITTYGFDQYANACIHNYQEIITAVVAALVNRKLTDNSSIATETAQPRILVDHILNVLEANGHLKQSKTLSGIRHIFELSPALKRSLSA